jgi:hypothetical protein
MPDPKPEFDLGQIVADANQAYFAPCRMDIEAEIMRGPFDYNIFWELFGALCRRAELRYEDRQDPRIVELSKQLDRALAQAEEIPVDPRHDEDEYLDDPRSAT